MKYKERDVKMEEGKHKRWESQFEWEREQRAPQNPMREALKSECQQ